LRTLRILLIDDDPDVLEYVASVLEEKYEVIATDDSHRALEILETDTPLDLLLTDIRMPGLNGIALAGMAILRRSKLPILYMTGFSEMAVDNVGLLLGGVIAKPFTPAVLLKAVEQALERVTSDENSSRSD
jgi:DNA-binding NtrC family response regulator